MSSARRVPGSVWDKAGRIAPGLAALAGYERAWLRSDLAAGLLVANEHLVSRSKPESRFHADRAGCFAARRSALLIRSLPNRTPERPEQVPKVKCVGRRARRNVPAQR